MISNAESESYQQIGDFLTYFFAFTGIILTLAAYVYPVNIFYTQRMIQSGLGPGSIKFDQGSRG